MKHIFIQAVPFTGLNGTKSTDRFIRPTHWHKWRVLNVCSFGK